MSRVVKPKTHRPEHSRVRSCANAIKADAIAARSADIDLACVLERWRIRADTRGKSDTSLYEYEREALAVIGFAGSSHDFSHIRRANSTICLAGSGTSAKILPQL
jgi:hypothetical protein